MPDLPETVIETRWSGLVIARDVDEPNGQPAVTLRSGGGIVTLRPDEVRALYEHLRGFLYERTKTVVE